MTKINDRQAGLPFPAPLADDAEVGASGDAQFLRLLRVAACTGFGAFHQLARHIGVGGPA